MNPVFLSLCFAWCGVSALAQGYINTFNAFAPTPGGEIAYIRDYALAGQGPLLSKAVGRVEIRSADGSMILSPVKDGTGNPLAVDGLFSLGVMAIPGTTPGSFGSILLRVWDSSTGSYYVNALERAEVLVTFPVLGTSSTPSNFVTDSNFTGLTLSGGPCPEPTSIALAAVGLVGFLWVARRGKAAKS